MLLLIVINSTQDLTKYKQILRELKISNQKVADYTGHSRETVTLWLNDRKPPKKMIRHLSEEIEEMIADKTKLDS